MRRLPLRPRGCCARLSPRSWGPEGLRRYESLITRRLDSVNPRGQIEKKFTVQAFEAELVDAEILAYAETESREGEPATMRPFRLLGAMTLVVLQPLRCVTLGGERNRE